MRKNIAIESTNVAALNASATQRAIDFGVASTASAPITGSRIIQVRSLVNITVLSFISSLLTVGRRASGVAAMDIKSLLYNGDKHNNDYRQHHKTAKEPKHIGLYPASLNMTQVATQRGHQTCRPIDQAINDIRIKCLYDVGDSKHTVANQQVVEFVDIVLVQEDTVQYAQNCMALHDCVDLCQIDASIERVSPGEAE